jgi:hypothetical protein
MYGAAGATASLGQPGVRDASALNTDYLHIDKAAEKPYERVAPRLWGFLDTSRLAMRFGL